MATATYKQAVARMAQDAWSMAVDRQRAAEAEMARGWTMQNMAAASKARKEQEKAWRKWQAAEARAAVA
jgi:hypothetical protein